MGNTCGVVSAKKLFGSSRRRASSTSHRSAANSSCDDSSSKKKPQKQQGELEKQQKEQERPKAKATTNMKEDAAIELLPGSVLGHKTENLKDLYTVGRKLGQGQFGTTYICTEISTGKDYACKSISKRKLVSPEDVEDVKREVQIMHHLSGYKNVVLIKGAYEDQSHVHIVMELCSGGELFDRIIQRGHFSERKAAELTKIIVGVVEACHSLGVMHRDLKPENFLLLNKDDDSSLKAIDFGLSVFFKPGQVFHDVVGSPYYVAPEVLNKHYGPEADVWTAGVILYILLSGVPPFWAETQQGIFDAVLKAEIDFETEPWPLISDSAKDLIRKMLCRTPSDRLTAHEVLCHPWICKNGVAPDKPLDPAVLSRLKQFSAMNKLKKMALRVIAESLSEEEIAGLREMFKAMDTDNSGAITFDELKAGLRKYGSTLKDTEIRDLMEAADVDKNGTIDYGEFIAATVHLNKLEREEHLAAAFSYFDKDGSGYITIDELQQACKDNNMEDAFLEDIIKEVDQNNMVSVGRKRFSADYPLRFRLMKGLIFITFLAILITLITVPHMTILDMLVCIFAFTPTGWGILVISQACKPLILRAGGGVWSWIRALARGYEIMMGLFLFTPVAFLAWFPFVSEFQSRMLFNPAFSRGLQISRILGQRKSKNKE